MAIPAENHRLCQLVATDPAYRRRVIEIADGRPPSGRSAPPPAIDPGLASAMELCDFRRSACGCLTKPSVCLQSAYPARVTLDDCRRCLGM